MELTIDKIGKYKLTKFRLQNYRCFADTGNIEIKPLNLLVGANSSGKSSILKFFPLLKQSVGVRSFEGVFNWYANDVDFKDFKNTVRENEKVITIDLEFRNDLRVSFDIVSDKDFYDKFQSVSLFEGGNLIYKYDANKLKKASKKSFLPYFYFHDKGSVEDKMETLDSLISFFANNINYIKPIRPYFNRYYRLHNINIKDIESDGSNLPMFLYNLSEKTFRSYNSFLNSNFGFKVSLRKSEGNIEILISENNSLFRNAVDMGFGYTEFLPLLTTIWRDCSMPSFYNFFIAIEQPEVHLHPKFQSKFAKLLCKIIDSYPNIRFLIETHSETILNTLGREIDYKRANPDDINVLLVEKHEDGISTVKSTGYDNDGYLKDWPVNFLDEDAD